MDLRSGELDDLPRRLAHDIDRAFPDLVAAFGDDLTSGMRRLAGPDADDLVQETFLRAYRALRSYDPARVRSIDLRAWMWTIALNVGRNHWRRSSRQPVPLVEDIGAPDPEPADARAWDRRLGALSLSQRRAVVLRHVVGLSYPEIADVTGRPEATTRSDVARGLARLRSIIAEEDCHELPTPS